MEQVQYITKSRKGKHLNYEERLKLEILLKAGKKSDEIGKLLGGRSGRTIRREINRGKVKLLNSDLTEREEYSAEVAQKVHDENGTAKGPGLKISKDYKLVEYLEEAIGKRKMSPYAAIETIKNNDDLQFDTSICSRTVYNYLDKDLFINISNKDLPNKKVEKRKYNKTRIAINNKRGTSISERPESIERREEYGHWELDTVVGGKNTKTVLLVMSERKYREELIFKIPSKSQACVIKVLDKLERKLGKEFYKKFKTITCDNGCENLDFEGMERSVLRKAPRTKIYYAHPYSAFERGTNENENKLIRRFIPKGEDIGKYSKKQIEYIEHWINNYPRKIFNGASSYMMIKKNKVA